MSLISFENQVQCGVSSIFASYIFFPLSNLKNFAVYCCSYLRSVNVIGGICGMEQLIWYCQPTQNTIWAKLVDSAFGSYTPCAINTFVISVSYLVLTGLCLYRLWLIITNGKAKRFTLRSNYYNYMLGLLAAFCAAQPLYRLIVGISAFNLSGESGLAPFEVGV